MAFVCAIHSSEGLYHRWKWASDAMEDGLCVEDIQKHVSKPEA
jgi:hypothetical protein